MRKRMYTTGLAVMCGLVLTATGLWASAASEAEPAAAADREMVRDPATGQMILQPQYGGSIAVAWTRDDQMHTDTWYGAAHRDVVSFFLEHLGMADWALDRDIFALKSAGAGDDRHPGWFQDTFLYLLLNPTLPRASKFLRTASLLPSTSARAFTGTTSPR